MKDLNKFSPLVVPFIGKTARLSTCSVSRAAYRAIILNCHKWLTSDDLSNAKEKYIAAFMSSVVVPPLPLIS